MMPFALPEPPTPEQIAAVEAYTRAANAHDIYWRRVRTGPWAFLWCSCLESGPERCRVHGQYLLTPDGKIL